MWDANVMRCKASKNGWTHFNNKISNNIWITINNSGSKYNITIDKIQQMSTSKVYVHDRTRNNVKETPARSSSMFQGQSHTKSRSWVVLTDPSEKKKWSIGIIIGRVQNIQCLKPVVRNYILYIVQCTQIEASSHWTYFAWSNNGVGMVLAYLPISNSDLHMHLSQHIMFPKQDHPHRFNPYTVAPSNAWSRLVGWNHEVNGSTTWETC